MLVKFLTFFGFLWIFVGCSSMPSLFKIEVIIEIEKDPTRLQYFPATLVRSSIFLHQIKSIKRIKHFSYYAGISSMVGKSYLK